MENPVLLENANSFGATSFLLEELKTITKKVEDSDTLEKFKTLQEEIKTTHPYIAILQIDNDYIIQASIIGHLGDKVTIVIAIH